MGRPEQTFAAGKFLTWIAVILVLLTAAAVWFRITHLGREPLASITAGSLRTIHTACLVYSSTYGTGFPSSLSKLGSSGPANAGAADLIDNVLASGVKSGYTFSYQADAPVNGVIRHYSVHADPLARGQTGQYSFYLDDSGVIRYSATSPATLKDPPLGQMVNH